MHDLKRNFKKYASTVTVNFRQRTYTGKAFITPLRYKNRVYLGDNFNASGRYDGGRYLYIGTPDVRLDMMDENATVIFLNQTYMIKRAELFSIGDEAVYVWAVLVKKRGGELIGDAN